MSLQAIGPVQMRAHGKVLKRLGRRVDSRSFDVRASASSIVLDLLIPEIEAGPIDVELDVDHVALKLLVPADAVIDHDELRRVGRGGVKDRTGTPSSDGRVIRLGGEMRSSEVRVHRGGVAVLSLLGSKESRAAVRRAHREGRL
jgi:hypothetical protein